MSSSKTISLVVSSVLSGSSAVGVGGWQIWDSSNPTLDTQLSKKGLSWNPVTSKMDVDISEGLHDASTSGTIDKFKLRTYGCFQRFFPNVTVNHTTLTTPPTPAYTKPSYDSNGLDSLEPIGCSLMSLSYEGVADANKNTKYIFKSEVTVKNDRFGWVLGAGAKDMSASVTDNSLSSSQKDIGYYLLFLKKETNNGSIVGGYYGTDTTFSSASYALDKLHIKTPKKEDGSQEIQNAKNKPTEKKSKLYYGVWEVSSEGTGEIFQDIEIGTEYNNKHKQNAEILGRLSHNNGSEIDFDKDIDIRATHFYVNSSPTSGGFTLSTPNNKVGSVLNSLYTPFKGKKGMWREDIEKYCRDKSSARKTLASLDQMKLENFCYGTDKTKA